MFLGIDVGGTKVRIGEVDKGRVINPFSESTQKKDIPNQIIRLINKFDIEKIKACGIAIAGQIKDGIVLFSPNIKEIKNLNLYKILKRRFDFPIFIENDCNCQTIGEYRYGAGRGTNTMVGVFIGTGIGGGIIIQGRLVGGSEIGHMVIDINGERCGCGKMGCFEALASGIALLRYAKEAGFPDGSASYIAKQAKEGNQKAEDIIKTLGNFISIGTTNLVNILNPDAVILGGGVISAIPLLVNMIKQSVQNQALFPCLIKKASLGPNSGIIGAASLSCKL